MSLVQVVKKIWDAVLAIWDEIFFFEYKTGQMCYWASFLNEENTIQMLFDLILFF